MSGAYLITRLVQLAGALVCAAVTLPAQDSTTTAPAVTDSATVMIEPKGTTVLWQPAAASYTFGEGASARTVEQLAIPLALVFPIHRRFTLDFTTAVAYTRVVHGDSTQSEIYGATDSQLRANINILMDRLVLTLGVNAPSGQYYVGDEQTEAASRIGNDFVFFPISSMGNGPAGTAGLAAAMQVLGVNLGLGGSLRKSMEFTPYGSGVGELRYQPADETRFRVTAERALWLGSTASLGVTFSQFGEDLANATTYSTGDRVITTAGWSVPVWRANLALSLWNLSRDEGQQLGGPAPEENIRNYAAVLNLPVKRWAFTPTAESREWRVSGDRAGKLVNYGISITIPAGKHTVLVPSYTRSSGTLYSQSDASTIPITGWQGSLLIRRR